MARKRYQAVGLEGFTFFLQAQGLSPHTIKNYVVGANLWRRWCDGRGLDYLKAGRNDMTTFLGEQSEVKAQSSVRLLLLTLRVYNDYLKDGGMVKANHAREIKLRKQVARPTEIFTDDELRRMIDAAENYRDRAIILLLVGSGLRRAEIYRVEKRHINYEAGTLQVFGKGSKYRTVAPGSMAIDALRFALRGRDQLFAGEADDDVVWRRVRRVAELAKIEGRVYPHRFRHTFAVNFCENGGGIDLLQTILGHSTLEMSMYYSKSGREQRALRAQQAYNPADRLFSNETAAGA